MRLALVLFAAAPALLLANVSDARPKADYGALTWANPNVSIVQYRLDAVECTSEGVFAILGDQPATSSASAGSTPVSTSTTAPNPMIDALDYQAAGLGGALRAREDRQDIVDQCLLNRGYTPVLLTDEQRDQLRALEHASPERRRYLYSLATDPNVIANQATEVPVQRRSN